VSGLYRRRRSDRGQPRSKRAGVLARAVELKIEQPSRSDKVINRILKRESGQTIPKSTMYHHLRRAGATRRKLRVPRMPSAKHTLGSKIKNIPAADNQQLQRWRHSGNKRLWERAVTILDSRDSTLEEICAKTERSPRSIHRWIRLYNTHGIEGLRRKSRDRSKSLKREVIADAISLRASVFGTFSRPRALTATANLRRSPPPKARSTYRLRASVFTTDATQETTIWKVHSVACRQVGGPRPSVAHCN